MNPPGSGRPDSPSQTVIGCMFHALAGKGLGVLLDSLRILVEYLFRKIVHSLGGYRQHGFNHIIGGIILAYHAFDKFTA